MAERVTWTNEKRRLGDLLPWPRNPRTIKNAQAERLVDSVETFGQVETLAIGPGNEIYNGHQRLSVLRGEYGADYEVDVRVASRALTEKEREKLTIYLHKGAAGEWDFDTLANEFEMDDLLAWGFEPFELGLSELEDDGPVGEDPGADVSKADELQAVWNVQLGDLWQLGDHRLICGDCTDEATVARVMGGDEAEMVWTDPPYGVAVGDKNKFLNSIARSNRVEENLQNDTLDEPALFAMLCAAFDNALTVCRAGGAWYVAAPAGPLHVLFGQALKDRGIWRQTIQWVKNNATFSPMGVDYHWQAEPIFYGWKPGAGHRFYGGRQQTTVWNIDRPLASPEHPTMKPIELVARAVGNSSQSGEVVYEPFSGSGTTIIACEQLGRKCRAVELHPPYVAVALQRWADMTGKTPTRIESAI